MSLVGTLVFCTDCGDLLNRAAHNVKMITCECCGISNENKWPRRTQTSSKHDAFPSALQKKHSDVQTIKAGEVETWAKTSKTCPVCRSPELYFRDMQLRGADEGSTIFYRCPTCSYRTKEDN